MWIVPPSFVEEHKLRVKRDLVKLCRRRTRLGGATLVGVEHGVEEVGALSAVASTTPASR
jgi:hypothetical protein